MSEETRSGRFRMELPEECISFYSEEGKTIFAEALASGHMNCYFKLAAQFRTQDEPAYCGLSTLVMILNALDVDPGVVWKGPWRWYHENMLSCARVSSSRQKETGRRTISMEQFTSVARNNLLKTSAFYTDSSSEEDFRQIIKEKSQRDDCFIVVGYSRECLHQNGDADFSPVGGYHPARDFVLLLDTARFKYPPYWIKLPPLLQAMNAIDPSTDLSRGYIVLKKKFPIRCSFLLRTSALMLPSPSSQIPLDILSFLQQWISYLCQISPPSINVQSVLEKSIEKLFGLVLKLKNEHTLIRVQGQVEVDPNTSSFDCPVQYSQELQHQLETTQVFGRVLHKIQANTLDDPNITQEKEEEEGKAEKSRKVFQLEEKKLSNAFLQFEHIIALLLLAWPFCCCTFHSGKNQNSLGKVLQDYIHQQYQIIGEPLLSELLGLRHQLSVRIHLVNIET